MAALVQGTSRVFSHLLQQHQEAGMAAAPFCRRGNRGSGRRRVFPKVTQQVSSGAVIGTQVRLTSKHALQFTELPFLSRRQGQPWRPMRQVPPTPPPALFLQGHPPRRESEKSSVKPCPSSTAESPCDLGKVPRPSWLSGVSRALPFHHTPRAGYISSPKLFPHL